MRFYPAVLLLLATILGLQPNSFAADPPKKAYLLFPVRTQLQRDYLFSSTTRYYLMVYGSSMIDEKGKLDASLLNFEDLSNDLGRIRFIGKDDSLQANLIFEKEPSEANERLLSLGILGWKQAMNYDQREPITIIGDMEWKSAIQLAGDSRGLFTENEIENAVGDAPIRIYPVRTVLSRIRTGADCVISFTQPYGEDATGLVDEKTKSHIKELVDSLKLKERKSVEFSIRFKKNANGKAVVKFTKETSKDLAKELGFKLHSVARSRAE